MLHLQHESRISKVESSQLLEYRLVEEKRLNEKIRMLDEELKDKEIISNDLQQSNKFASELKNIITQLEEKLFELNDSREMVKKLNQRNTSLHKVMREKENEMKKLSDEHSKVKKSERRLFNQSQSLNNEILKLNMSISSLKSIQDTLSIETNGLTMDSIE